MADYKITQLTENTTPITTDILPMVDDPGGTPVTQKVTIANLKTGLALVKGDVGLGSVDNTTDAGKPVSTATQTALDLKAPLASPTLTGTVTVPTPFTLGAVSVLPTGTELNFVDGVTSNIQTQLNAKEATANKDATGGYAGLTLFKINFKNAANTFTNFLTNATTAARTYTYPDVSDTMAVLGLAQTFTGANTHSGLNALLVSSSGLTIRNPANTFKYTITAAAIVADRILNLPLITGTDTLGALGIAATWTAIQTFTTPVIGAATGTSVVLTGAITSSGTAGIGYASGAGGAVTQLTSKVTAFTLSKTVGTIQFAADSLAANTSSAGATWTNTTIAANDVVVFTHSSGGTAGAYTITCAPAAGSANLKIRNITPSALAEAPIFRFAVIKGVVA